MPTGGASEIWPGILQDNGGAAYNVKHPDYNVKGDGKTVADGAMTSGSAVLTSATAGFTSADVGKMIYVGKASSIAGTGTVTATAGAVVFSASQLGVLQGDPLVAGAIIVVAGTEYTLLTFDGTLTGTISGAPTFAASAFTVVIRLATTVSAFTNATTVTLAATAGRTVSGALLYWGTDNGTAINAIFSVIAAGSEVVWPGGIYMTSAQISYSRAFRWRGSVVGEGSAQVVAAGVRIVGSGFTVVRATETPVFDSLQISDPFGHPSTILLDINDGTNLVTNWSLRDVFLTGVNTSKMGTALRLVGALKGVMVGGAIEGCGIARDFQSISGNKSNANAFYSVKVRANTYGLKTTDVDNLFIYGETNEGNLTGMKHESGVLHTFGVHFENNVGPKRQLHITGGNLVSTGDEFYQSGADLEIYVESGAGRHSIVAPVFNTGIKHNGTGQITVLNTVNIVPVSGTGPIVRIDGGGIQGLQGTAALFLAVSGFVGISGGVPTLNQSAAAKIGGTAGVQFSDQNGNVKAHVDVAGAMFPQQTAAGIYSGTGTPLGAVVAAIGSIFLRTDGGAATTLYVKESGTGASTGWVAK